jgi:hypothetical protein
MKNQYLDWFKKDFHPSQHPVIRQYPVWIETLEKTNDPMSMRQPISSIATNNMVY